MSSRLTIIILLTVGLSILFLLGNQQKIEEKKAQAKEMMKEAKEIINNIGNQRMQDGQTSSNRDISSTRQMAGKMLVY